MRLAAVALTLLSALEVESKQSKVTLCFALDPGCEWRIVFKAVEGNGRDVYSDFITPGYLNAHVHGVKQLSSTAPFRDSLTLERWDHLEVDQVFQADSLAVLHSVF